MKKPQIIALILIAIATSFFVLNLDSGGSYGSFTQAKNKPDNEFTVAGELNQNKQIVYSPKVNANYFSFFMHDKKGNEMQVILNEHARQKGQRDAGDTQ
jgi:cytochrome c-type biogenesis protein CcmE